MPGDKNRNFPKLLKTMIVGALWFRLGLMCIRILLFFKLDEKLGVSAPYVMRENVCSM